MLKICNIKILRTLFCTIFCLNLIYAPEPGDDFEDAKDIRVLHVTYDDQRIIDVDFAINQYNEDKKRTGGQTVNRVDQKIGL